MNLMILDIQMRISIPDRFQLSKLRGLDVQMRNLKIFVEFFLNTMASKTKAKIRSIPKLSQTEFKKIKSSSGLGMNRYSPVPFCRSVGLH